MIAGIYIDGVDENAAPLPRDGLDRSHTLKIELGDSKTITAIAPEPTESVRKSRPQRWVAGLLSVAS